MAAQQQQQGGGGDNSMAAVWIIVALFVALWLIWYIAHDYIVSFVFTIKLWEAQLISLYTDEVQPAIDIIQNTPPANVSFEQLINLSDFVGRFFALPFAIVLFVLGIFLYFSDPTLRYKRVHSMNTLRDQEKLNWPQILPVSKLDLINTDVDKGPWAMSQTPMDFAKKHKLLREEPDNPLVIHGRAYPRVSVIKSEAKNVFTLQLGRAWGGVEELKPHEKALFAAFSAKINRKGNLGDKLLEDINLSTEGEKLDFTGSQELIDKYFNTKGVQMAVQRHAYVLTVMASMLEKAREDGVLPTANFIWLKPVDRRLWYMLNSIGRQTPFTEVAGPFGHWLAENELGRKIATPMVDEAVKALEIAIAEVIYQPDDD